MNSINVTKRDGSLEELDIEKINRVVGWACSDITGVSSSEVIIRSKLKFYDKIPTAQIHQNLLDTAEELITADTPNYDKVSARLYLFNLRKEVYGDIDLTIPYHQVVHEYIEKGLYPVEFRHLSDDLIDECWSLIKQDWDFDIPSYGLKQMYKKYCVTNRATKQIHETPSMVYMRVCLVGAMIKQAFADGRTRFEGRAFTDYDEKKIIKDFRNYYNQFAGGINSLPSPIMNGVGTPTRQYSSCTGIEPDDSIDGINAASSALIKYVTSRAGIGLNVGRLRPIGEAIRNGEVVSTGIVNWIRKFQGDILSCSQGGFRKSAATLYAPLWHFEFPEMVVLKDNTIAEERSARSLDFAFTINGYLYKRLLAGKDITLFSPNAADGELYEAFSSDQERFAELYEQLEADPSVRKRTFSAEEIFTRMLMMQRKETGRIYIMNIDHVNEHGAFRPDVAPVYMSNLCLEITLPTKSMKHIDDAEYSEIFLCTLANINMGKVKKLEDLKDICYHTVRFLDDLLDYQDYPVKAAEKWGLARRSLGVGVNNYAYWLAKQGFVYGDEGSLKATHEFFEAFQYYLILASVELAKEKGPCAAFHETKYSQGILPIDTYRKKVDTLGDFELKLDWEWLRAQVLEHGMRNSTLSAIPPSETSSQVIRHGSTNGVEKARALMTVRSNKDISGRTLVPEVKKLKNKYDLLWDSESPEGYLKCLAVMQKFIDQSISANTSYNPSHFEGNEIPMSLLMKNTLQTYDWGLKTLYYNNTDKKVEKDKEETEGDKKPEMSGADKMAAILAGPGDKPGTDDPRSGNLPSSDYGERAAIHQTSREVAVEEEEDDGCGGACRI